MFNNTAFSEITVGGSDGESAEATGKRERTQRHEESPEDPQGDHL